MTFVPLPDGVDWNIERAMAIVRAYFAHPDRPGQDNPEFQQALRRMVTPGTAGATQAEVGRTIFGFVMLCSVLLDGVARATGQTLQQVLDAYTAEIERHIAGTDS